MWYHDNCLWGILNVTILLKFFGAKLELTWMNWMVMADLPTPPPPTTTNLYVLATVSPIFLLLFFYQTFVTSFFILDINSKWMVFPINWSFWVSCWTDESAARVSHISTFRSNLVTIHCVSLSALCPIYMFKNPFYYNI